MEHKEHQSGAPFSYFRVYIKLQVSNADLHFDILPITGVNRTCPLGASTSETYSRLLPGWVNKDHKLWQKQTTLIFQQVLILAFTFKNLSALKLYNYLIERMETKTYPLDKPIFSYFLLTSVTIC